jgi:hypothetical protein
MNTADNTTDEGVDVVDMLIQLLVRQVSAANIVPVKVRVITSSLSPTLAPDEPSAPTSILTAAKRAALIVCLNGGGTFYNRRGIWGRPSPKPGDKRISGATVADLARDGMLSFNGVGRAASARLTVRGSWFARTAAVEMAEEINLQKAGVD